MSIAADLTVHPFALVPDLIGQFTTRVPRARVVDLFWKGTERSGAPVVSHRPHRGNMPHKHRRASPVVTGVTLVLAMISAAL
jgi:hypothetical protein